MAGRTVDLVASGPAPVDPYAPDGGIWSVARAAVERGDRVRVLYPQGGIGGAPPDGVVAEAVPFALKRPGTALEGADFAAAAGRRIRREAELVLRDPAGLGPLGIGGRRASSARLVALVRSLEVRAFEREQATAAPGGFLDRLGSWQDRRAVRRLERAALLEPDLVFCASPELVDLLATEYGIDRARLRPTTPPVPELPEGPTREAARAQLGIPPDVPAVVAPLSLEDAEAGRTEAIREAFRRIRPLFPGVRLVLAGTTAPTDPGVLSVPARTPEAFSAAIAAADVALIAPGRAGFDPGVVFAHRAAVATLATRSVVLPVPAGPSIRVAPSDDAGDVASTLAELVADPAARREMAVAGRELARRFDPSHWWEEIDRAIGATR